MIKYKILSVDDAERSVRVRFFTDTVTEEKMAQPNSDGVVERGSDGSPLRCRTDYTVNIWKVPTPSSSEVHDEIMRNAPAGWLELMEAVADEGTVTALMPTLSDSLNETLDWNPPKPPMPVLSRRQLLLGLSSDGFITNQEARDSARTGAPPSSIASILDQHVNDPDARIAADVTWAAMSGAWYSDPLTQMLKNSQNIPDETFESMWRRWAQL